MDKAVAAHLLDFIERTSDFVGVTDDSGNVVYLNEAAFRRLGRPVDNPGRLTTEDIFPESVFHRYFTEIRPVLLEKGVWSGLLPMNTVGAGSVDAWLTVVAGLGSGGDVEWLVTSGRDMTEWTRARDVLNWQATHDELTGVWRRGVLADKLGAALARARRSGDLVAVVYLDIDGFMAVNDSFGHEAGDLVLSELGRRLTLATRETDTVVRVGGDEFVVVVEGLADPQAADAVTGRLREAVASEPVALGEVPVPVAISMGMAVGPGEADASDLLQQADTSMYRWKGRPAAPLSSAWVHPRPRGTGPSGHQVAVALTQQLVEVHYQPVVRLADGSIAGIQALARLGHDTTAEFVQAVEGSAVGTALDLAVLRRVVSDGAGWQARSLYVHFSRSFLSDRSATRHLESLLDQSGLDPSDLAIEVAEPILSDPAIQAAGTLAALHRLGVRLVASHVGRDEPGTAVTGTGLVDEVLLDRAVVARLDDHGPAGPYADLLASLRRSGLRAVAAGVETDRQRARLVELGCELGMGYLFGAPAPR
jgi:diguanylate cyclase (GGDEF)-like protein